MKKRQAAVLVVQLLGASDAHTTLEETMSSLARIHLALIVVKDVEFEFNGDYIGTSGFLQYRCLSPNTELSNASVQSSDWLRGELQMSYNVAGSSNKFRLAEVEVT